jgi:hypothetical protein
MSPDDMRPDTAAFTPLPSHGQPAHGRIEVWVGSDVATDNLIVLRADESGGCTLVDPQNGWRQVRRFTAYEAAYRWLAEEAYERADGR